MRKALGEDNQEERSVRRKVPIKRREA